MKKISIESSGIFCGNAMPKNELIKAVDGNKQMPERKTAFLQNLKFFLNSPQKPSSFLEYFLYCF